MLDRQRINLLTRIGALLLALVFIGSFVLMGVGSTFPSYNIFELFGGGAQTTPQGNSLQTQIQQAEGDVKANPKDANAVKRLAYLYIQDNQLDKSAAVLEDGQKNSPQDSDIPLLLGQVYQQQAQDEKDPKKQRALNKKAGDEYAAATKLSPKNAQTFLLAGDAYETAGEPALAVEYWNGYLALEPTGQKADQVKQKISNMLKAGGGKTQP